MGDDTQCIDCNTALHYVLDNVNHVCVAETPGYKLDPQGISIPICPIGAPDKTTNLLTNGDFESGDSGWSYIPEIEIGAGTVYNSNWTTGNVL